MKSNNPFFKKLYAKPKVDVIFPKEEIDETITEASFQNVDKTDYSLASQEIGKTNHTLFATNKSVDLNVEAENYWFNEWKHKPLYDDPNEEIRIVQGEPQFDYRILESLTIKGKRYCIMCAELNPPKQTPIGRKKYFCHDHREEYDSWRGEKEKHRLRFNRKHLLLKNEGIGTTNIREHPRRKKIGVDSDGNHIYNYNFNKEAKTVRNEWKATFEPPLWKRKLSKKELYNLEHGISFREILLDKEVAYSYDFNTMYYYVGKDKRSSDDDTDSRGSDGDWEYYYGNDERLYGLVDFNTFFAPTQPKYIPTLEEIYENWDYWLDAIPEDLELIPIR